MDKNNFSNNSPLISVIIPVYNTLEKYLVPCLESVLNQKYRNLQIIIVNDGSTFENIEPLLLKYQKKDDRIVYLKKQNSGPADARNIGLKHSTGDYITFVDADDILVDGAVGSLVCLLQTFNADTAIMGIQMPGLKCGASQGKLLNTKEQRQIELDVVAFQHERDDKHDTLLWDSQCGKLFNRRIINRYNLQFVSGLARSEDALFCLDYYERSRKIVIDNKVIYRYVLNDNSLTHSISNNSLISLPELMMEFEKRVNHYHNGDQEFQLALAKHASRGLSEVIYTYFYNEHNNIKLHILYKEYKTLLNEPIMIKYLNLLKSSQVEGFINKFVLICFKCHIYKLPILMRYLYIVKVKFRL